MSRRTTRAGAGLLAMALVAALGASPAAAQEGQEIPDCGDRPATLQWEVRKDRKRRSVNLEFASGNTNGAPMKPVQVRIVRRRATRELQWRNLNRSHYSYRRRGGERARLTARYVENRSRYDTPGSGGGDQLPLPDLPLIPDLPILPLPGLPGLPDLPLPVLPLLTGAVGGPEFVPDYCVRTITRSAR